MCLKSFILALCSVAVTLDPPSPSSWKVCFSLQIYIKCYLHGCWLCPSVKGQEVPFILSVVFSLTSNLPNNLVNEFEVSSYFFWKVADFFPEIRRLTVLILGPSYLTHSSIFLLVFSFSFILIWNFMKTSSRESPYSVGFWVYFKWSNLSLSTQEPFKFCFLSFIISSSWYHSEITF